MKWFTGFLIVSSIAIFIASCFEEGLFSLQTLLLSPVLPGAVFFHLFFLKHLPKIEEIKE
jgi:hypothetical protein